MPPALAPDPASDNIAAFPGASDDTLRRTAIAHAELGQRVFRLVQAGKTPAFPGWQNEASSDAGAIASRWSDPVGGAPLGYNVGLCMGGGFIAIDIDVKNGVDGCASLATLEKELGPLPATWTTSTPSGGQHLVFRTPPDIQISNSAGRLGPGLDVRGNGGYVVGVGSITPRGRYSRGRPGQSFVDLPAAWREHLARSDLPRTRNHAIVAPDDPSDIERMRDWLAAEAPAAIEGAGGDAVTYEVAARLGDFVSQPTALDLMLEHWNERCSPPWDPDELSRKVENAFHYRQRTEGASSAALEFDDVSADVAAAETVKGAPAAPEFSWLAPRPFTTFDSATIPPREWVVDGFLCRRYVTGLVAPPGMGKTNLALLALTAVVTGRGEIFARSIPQRQPCWFWCQEDDDDELARRVNAIRLHHGLEPSDFYIDDRPALLLNSGSVRPLKLFERGRDGNVRPSSAVPFIIDRIRDERIACFAIDPLLEFHDAEENDNREMQLIWGVARRIATEANCAALVVAHSKKPPKAKSDEFVGEIDSLRGGSSQAGTMRLGFTLYGMSEKDARATGISKEERSRFLRLDDAKANIKEKSPEPTWFRKVGVTLLNGENVGSLAPVALSRSRVVAPDSMLERVGLVLRESFSVGEWHRATDVLRKAFPDTSTTSERSRTEQFGRLTKGEAAFPTDRGTVHVKEGVGRSGRQLRLTDN